MKSHRKLALLLFLLTFMTEFSRSKPSPFDDEDANDLSSIKCFVCEEHKDCNPNKFKRCPPGDNACLTREGPGKKMSKLCAYNNIQGTFRTDGVESGELFHWCDYDLCNKGDFSDDSRSTGEEGSAAVTISVSWSLVMLGNFIFVVLNKKLC